MLVQGHKLQSTSQGLHSTNASTVVANIYCTRDNCWGYNALTLEVNQLYLELGVCKALTPRCTSTREVIAVDCSCKGTIPLTIYGSIDNMPGPGKADELRQWEQHPRYTTQQATGIKHSTAMGREHKSLTEHCLPYPWDYVTQPGVHNQLPQFTKLARSSAMVEWKKIFHIPTERISMQYDESLPCITSTNACMQLHIATW